MNHTPTPWAVSPGKKGFPRSPRAVTTADIRYDKTGVAIAGKIIAIWADKCDAAFIVRACNSHEALVEACQELLQELVDRGIVLPANDRVRAALKLAGGK